MRWCEWMIAKDQEIRAQDFSVGRRGWCYLMENERMITKGEFDRAEKLITDCRKNGKLPFYICAEDESRAADYVEQLDQDDTTQEAADWLDSLLTAHERWNPESFWDHQDYDIEMLTEKLDLKSLFAVVCRKYHIPLANMKGWSDLNLRGRMAERFAEMERRGKQCVLLVCGDHDPGGLHITDKLLKNFEQISKATGWTPDNLTVSRFGLNYDFIEANGLTWIDNLETSSGLELDDPDHADRWKVYVDGYIEQFGVRKVEANALVIRPVEGRQLAERAILEFLNKAGIKRYNAELTARREELRQEIRKQLRRIKRTD